MKTKRQLLKNTPVKNVLMDVDGLALLNCFSQCEHPAPGRTIAILNIGHSYTNLAVANGEGVPFIRDISYGANNIIQQIANENDMSPQTVRDVLHGNENLPEAKLVTAVSLERAAQKLIVDITKTLRYYNAQQKSAFIEEVFVCGGFALVEDFIQLLNRDLSTKVVLWNPFNKMRCENDNVSKDTLENFGPALAVAAGLAMRSI